MREIEASLGLKLATLRDELLGDAVVLVLRLDPDAPPDPRQARGLFLLRARDPALLERLIATVNAAQRNSGELERVEDRTVAGTIYHVRTFPAATGRPPESYVNYPDGTFAFSNSANLIQGVIERKGRASSDRTVPSNPGLGDLPKFQAVQRRLPERALARLYVDPRAIERLLAAVPRSSDSSDVRILDVLVRYVAAVDSFGAALTWGRNTIAIHTIETLDPSRLDPWLRRWAGDSRRIEPRVAERAGVHSGDGLGDISPVALWDAGSQLIPKGRTGPAGTTSKPWRLACCWVRTCVRESGPAWVPV